MFQSSSHRCFERHWFRPCLPLVFKIFRNWISNTLHSFSVSLPAGIGVIVNLYGGGTNASPPSDIGARVELVLYTRLRTELMTYLFDGFRAVSALIETALWSTYLQKGRFKYFSVDEAMPVLFVGILAV